MLQFGVSGVSIVFILASVIMINDDFNKALLILLVTAEAFLIINFMVSLYFMQDSHIESDEM